MTTPIAIWEWQDGAPMPDARAVVCRPGREGLSGVLNLGGPAIEPVSLLVEAARCPTACAGFQPERLDVADFLRPEGASSSATSGLRLAPQTGRGGVR